MAFAYVDAHAHIHEPEFEHDLESVLARMRERDVAAITVGTDQESSERAVRLSESEHGIWAAVGLHPTDKRNESFDEGVYRSLAMRERVVAIGECGLDYYRASPDQDEKRRQRDIFEAQIHLAASLEKPLMLHVRNAHPDALEILASRKREYGEKLWGDAHFFTDTIETARRYFDLDFTVSFTGVITFTDQYDDVVRFAPGTHILAETDCPYAAPVPYRGGRNEPAYVVETAQRIAALRGEPEEAMAEQLTTNARRVFGLD